MKLASTRMSGPGLNYGLLLAGGVLFACVRAGSAFPLGHTIEPPAASSKEPLPTRADGAPARPSDTTLKPLAEISATLVQVTDVLVERVIVLWTNPSTKRNTPAAPQVRASTLREIEKIAVLERLQREQFKLRRDELSKRASEPDAQRALRELAVQESDLNTVLIPLSRALKATVTSMKPIDAVQPLRAFRGRTVAMESLRRIALAAVLVECGDAASMAEASEIVSSILELPEGEDPLRTCPPPVVGWALLLATLHDLPTPEGSAPRVQSRRGQAAFAHRYAVAFARARFRAGADEQALGPTLQLAETDADSAIHTLCAVSESQSKPLPDQPYPLRAARAIHGQPGEDVGNARRMLADLEALEKLPRPLRMRVVARLARELVGREEVARGDLDIAIAAAVPLIRKDAPPDKAEGELISSVRLLSSTLTDLRTRNAEDDAARADKLIGALVIASQRDIVHSEQVAFVNPALIAWETLRLAVIPGVAPQSVAAACELIVSNGDGGLGSALKRSSTNEHAAVIDELWLLVIDLAEGHADARADGQRLLTQLEPALATLDRIEVRSSRGLYRAALYALAAAMQRAAPRTSEPVPEAEALIARALASPVGNTPQKSFRYAYFLDELLRASWAFELSKSGRYQAASAINRDITAQLTDYHGFKYPSLKRAFWFAWAGTLEELARTDAKANATEIRLQLRRLKGISSSLGGRDFAERFRAIEAALPPL